MPAPLVDSLADVQRVLDELWERNASGAASDVVHYGAIGSAFPVLQSPGADVTSGFSLPRSCDALLTFHGSGYAPGVGLGYLNCYLDGVFISGAAHLFNQTAVHMAFVPFAMSVTLAPGAHSVRMTPGANCSRDSNDFNLVTLVALG